MKDFPHPEEGRRPVSKGPLIAVRPQPLQTRSAAPVWLAFTPGLFVFLWATGFIGARLSADNAEPFSFLFVRCLIVAAILTVAASPSGRRGRAAAAVHAMVVGALIHGGYLGLVFWSINNGLPAGVSALIVGLQPLLTALIAAPVLGERITARHWLGLAVGILGIALVVWPRLTFGDHGITPLTVGASMLATVSIAIGSIYQKRHITGLDLRSGNVLQFLGAAIAVGLVALLSENFEITWTGEVVFAMAWLVLVLSIGATTLLYLMIRHGEVSRIAGLFYLVPAVTAAIAWLLFDETLSPVQILGMAVCAGAVMLVTRRA
jgi:drug/metabolite transporter (DMT)-like permease